MNENMKINTPEIDPEMDAQALTDEQLEDAAGGLLPMKHPLTHVRFCPICGRASCSHKLGSPKTMNA